MKVRVVLGILTFFMFFTYQLSRFNINIAIVAINHEESINNSTLHKEQWDGKAIVLGAFFYMSWITELTGAYLLARFGCRIVMSVTFGLNAIACFLFPLSYYLHPLCAAVLRLLQGLIWGTTWPTVAWISSRWIPKSERSKFMSCYLGSSFGASFANFFGGLVTQYLGWPYIFYGTGLISLTLLIFWWPFASDSPSTNSRISPEEREYLEKNVEANITIKKTKQSVPWLRIFASLPFWAILFTFFSLLWFLITLAMQMPSYFDTVFNLNIKTNGLLLSIPDLLKVVVGIYFPYFIDGFVKKKKLTIYSARRISAAIGMIIPGILIIFLGYFGHRSVELATAIIILAVGINGTASSSILANVVDISPNHAGSIMGVVKTAANIPGIISPLLVTYIFANDINNWPTVFLIIGILTLSGTIFYLTFMSTEIQPWDNLDSHINDIGEKENMIELEKLEKTNGHTHVEDKNGIKDQDPV